MAINEQLSMMLPVYDSRHQSWKITLVDPENYIDVCSYKWRIKWSNTNKNSNTVRKPYVWCRVNGKELALHRLVAQTPVGLFCDHVNGNTLDNRNENLRVATPSQNAMNRRSSNPNKSSKFKGVSYRPTKKLNWVSYIKMKQRRLVIGYFNSEEDAARAYDVRAIELFAEYAALNFPPE